MILEQICFIFKNKKLFFKKGSLTIETIIILGLMFVFLIVIIYFVIDSNSKNVNIVDEFAMFKGASYD